MMDEYLRYIRYDLAKETDTIELISHLSMNGYEYGFDMKSYSLFIYEEEMAYVETIMNDRKIIYTRKEI